MQLCFHIKWDLDSYSSFFLNKIYYTPCNIKFAMKFSKYVKCGIIIVHVFGK
jgi:hypothetical protein